MPVKKISATLIKLSIEKIRIYHNFFKRAFFYKDLGKKKITFKFLNIKQLKIALKISLE